MPLTIANAAGFLGDQLDAPRRLVDQATVDFLTLEYLAELTLSILARQRQRDPASGYARDFLDVLPTLVPSLKAQHQLRLVTNAGGMNPEMCARNAARILVDAGLHATPIAVVAGDDLLGRIEQLQAAGCRFEHFDTRQPLEDLVHPIISANAYLGARPIVEALDQDARLVITGRVADASLTLGPAVHRFGWAWDDWNRLAASSVAGHLIECGAQVTGGYSTRWHGERLEDVGYPIAELQEDGDCVITKPAGSGGRVDCHTVVEQLIYEIGDPSHYLTPDVNVDFTGVVVEDAGPDRVRVEGARGTPAPDTYKVSLAYHAGYTASSQLLVYGNDCVAKAEACASMIFDRLARAGVQLQRRHVECLGRGDGVPQTEGASGNDPVEVVLRVSVEDPRREAVERFTRETAPLITSGPAGLAGYAAGRSPVRSVLAFWPTTVPRELVDASVSVNTAAEWAAK